jgi:hypothetical protein
MMPPGQGPTGVTAVDAKLDKHIDTLFRNSQMMPVVTIMGVFIPIVLVFAGPLGLVYAAQRARLLRRIDNGELSLSGPPPLPGAVSVQDKIATLRRQSLRLIVPGIIMGVYALFLAAVMLMVVLGNRSR